MHQSSQRAPTLDSKMPNIMKQKLQTLLTQLNQGLVEREQVMKAALLTMLAGENLVLIGPPGTAKSLIARRIAGSLADMESPSTYFEYLLTKFSTPEEIFGPLSISELKADRFKRNTAGYLPTVKVAFLDEIFKASSSILNALLTILNERIYHNGADRQNVPLQALISASNELPTDQDELNALYDRFLVRVFVDYVSVESLPRLFEPTTELELSANSKLSERDIESIHEVAAAVTIPQVIVQAIQRIWAAHKEAFKEDRRENLSDRRLKKIIHLLRVSAATNGRQEVDLSDVLLLKSCLWNYQENAIKVQELVLRALRSFSYPVPNQSSMPHETAPVSSLLGAKQKSLVKGFKGSGTAHDPLLIETATDLAHLQNLEVGQQGYFFRQMADIDISELSTWPEITFKGDYEGNGYAIEDNRDQKNGNWLDLFADISDSKINGLQLRRCNLTAQAQNSHINACEADSTLVSGSATNCTIAACKVGCQLVSGTIKDCTISTCQSQSICKTADHCSIADCMISINLIDYQHIQNGIAGTLKNQSLVERCFITGKVGKANINKQAIKKLLGVEMPYGGESGFRGKFAAIASKCQQSIIRQCAIGELEIILYEQLFYFEGVVSKSRENTTLDYVSIDSNNMPADKNVQLVSATLFTQRYFEHTLGWDFGSIWIWDTHNNQPRLRENVTGINQSKINISSHLDIAEIDLLTQQIRANIWL